MTDLGCLGLIQSWFQLFRRDSRPISACFGRRPIRSNSADTTRFWPNWPGSAGISPNWSQVGANPKKKKTQTWYRHTGSSIGRGCSAHFATSVHHRIPQYTSNIGKTWNKVIVLNYICHQNVFPQVFLPKRNGALDNWQPMTTNIAHSLGRYDTI